jgi:transcription elongation GreA/GreB family factor
MEKIKQQLYELCQDYIQKRIQAAQHAIEAAQESANSETKSSSGDKYETGRAMMQLEIEKNAAQLAESHKLKQAMDHIQIQNTSSSVQPGSLVVTDRETFFIAISLGKVIMENKSYLVISAGSPLGQKLSGLRSGDQIAFRDRTYVIQKIA